MKARVLLGTLAATGAALGIGQFTATAVPGEGGTADSSASVGPDVIVGAIGDGSGATVGTSTYKGATVTVNGAATTAYAFGTVSCNIGSVPLRWWQNTSYHPVIPENAYRIMNGRIEQIGVGWMKHGFCALQESLCATCVPDAGCGSSQSQLGVGCSDPYTASLNGSQSNLGPRYEVNVSTGVYPATGSTIWPSVPAGQTNFARLVQIKNSDLNPTANAGAVYVAEAMYVHPDDAQAGNNTNNASYRTFTVSGSTSFALTLTGSTMQTKPAIYHWAVVNPSVQISTADAADGRYVLGCNVTANANGTYHYEYAVYNYTSDSAGASFGVPVPAAAVVTNATFKDVAYHSGEPFDGTDWTVTTSGGQVKWQCTQTYAQNANANALRWGTLYNFAFDCTVPPNTGAATIGLFKVSSSVNVVTKVPSCKMGDVDCSGHVDGGDLGILFSNWGLPGVTDFDGNGITNGVDLGIMIAQWG